MQVTFEHLGNYGNVFFQYAYMRKVADDYGYKPVLPEWDLASWHLCYPVFFEEFIALKDQYEVKDARVLNEYSFSDKNHKVYLSDSDNIGKDNIRLQGYFQDWELYKDVDQIKSYFNIPDVEPNKDDLLLSLRINRDFNGDGSSTCMITDPQVLVKLVDEIIGNYNSLTIIADVHNHHVFDMFKRFAPKVVCRDGRLPNDDFRDILSYENIIIPCSTFTWWGCYLGHCKNVYMPNSFGTMGVPGMNKGIQAHNLPDIKLLNIPGKNVNLYNAPFRDINTVNEAT